MFGAFRSNGVMAEAVQGRDSDDEAENQPAMTTNSTSGIRSFLPSFSNSKYARAHRRNSVRLPPGVREPGRFIKDSGDVHVEPKVWLANESKSSLLCNPLFFVGLSFGEEGVACCLIFTLKYKAEKLAP